MECVCGMHTYVYAQALMDQGFVDASLELRRRIVGASTTRRLKPDDVRTNFSSLLPPAPCPLPLNSPLASFRDAV